jgi:2-amino-4-hydroxy-6-hydroxymethyldihydropteridine diphosphokinase
VVEARPDRSPVPAWIALGSNLGPREAIFERAIALLESEPRVRVVARSRWRVTPPMGPDQPAFLNGVVQVETTLPPEVLLALLHAVERACGRVRRGGRWGPRVLDLDLIRYGDGRIARPGLVLPHPGWRRPFVRGPLEEVGGVPQG